MNKTNNDLFDLPQKECIIMHIDMNSYFATCEQQANPAWQGKPLGVCSYLHPKGTIIAASREAKKLGIGTGTKVGEAQQICPGIVLVSDEPAKYRAITERIQVIFNSYTPDVENYSIDESFLRFDVERSPLSLPQKLLRNPRGNRKTGMTDSRNVGAQDLEPDVVGAVYYIGQEIKRRIKQEVGEWITCSIGIGQSKFMAKIGSDFQKPDGLVVVDKNNVDGLLEQLELMDVWGISYGLKRQFNALGIFTPLQIKYAKPSFLMKKMGKMGYFLWSRMNGLEIDKLQTEPMKASVKSVGHSYTLLKKTANKDELALLIMKLSEKVGRRLRRKGKRGKVCWIGWKYIYGGGFARQQQLDESIDDGYDIFRHTYKHLAGKVLHDKISKIYISVSGLEEAKHLQLSFLEDKLKKSRLLQSMDKINDKYGEMTVTRGMHKNWTEEIRDRVAFGHRP